MELMKSLAFITCIESCNGMCRRVLEDIQKDCPDIKDLIEAYFNDKYHEGRDYKYIMELGELLKKISSLQD